MNLPELSIRPNHHRVRDRADLKRLGYLVVVVHQGRHRETLTLPELLHLAAFLLLRPHPLSHIHREHLHGHAFLLGPGGERLKLGKPFSTRRAPRRPEVQHDCRPAQITQRHLLIVQRREREIRRRIPLAQPKLRQRANLPAAGRVERDRPRRPGVNFRTHPELQITARAFYLQRLDQLRTWVDENADRCGARLKLQRSKLGPILFQSFVPGQLHVLQEAHPERRDEVLNRLTVPKSQLRRPKLTDRFQCRQLTAAQRQTHELAGP